MNDGRVIISYAGVHQAFQFAQAAHEIAELKAFYCSLYDDRTKWGGRFGGYIGSWLNDGRRAEGLDLDKVQEFPWPLILKATRDRIYPRAKHSWFATNTTFDWWASRQLAAKDCEIFIGTASSDLFSLQVARAKGATLLHDCPGMHPSVGSQLLAQAAEQAKINFKPRRRPWPPHNAMQSRILREFDVADVLLTYSEFHRAGFEKMGFPPDRLHTIPLGVDTVFWSPSKLRDHRGFETPLKLLFVGQITLSKGVPFLLDAVAQCRKAVQLTMVGAYDSGTDRLLDRSFADNVTLLPHQPQATLRQIYQSHDVLIMPSISDPFPRVVLEAMATGLPVISTDHVGTPVPETNWRVRAMSSQCLVQRIMQYVDDRTMIRRHGSQAREFSMRFSTRAFRQNLQSLLLRILATRGSRMAESPRRQRAISEN